MEYVRLVASGPSAEDEEGVWRRVKGEDGGEPAC
jgi:hypothetical protein